MFKMIIDTLETRRTSTTTYHVNLGFAMEHASKLLSDNADGLITLLEVIVLNPEGDEVYTWEAE